MYVQTPYGRKDIGTSEKEKEGPLYWGGKTQVHKKLFRRIETD